MVQKVTRNTKKVVFFNNGGECVVCGQKVMFYTMLKFLKGVKVLSQPNDTIHIWTRKGVTYSALAATVDHLVPRYYSGGNEITNLALKCLKCHKKHTLEVFDRDKYTYIRLGVNQIESKQQRMLKQVRYIHKKVHKNAPEWQLIKYKNSSSIEADKLKLRIYKMLCPTEEVTRICNDALDKIQAIQGVSKDQVYIDNYRDIVITGNFRYAIPEYKDYPLINISRGNSNGYVCDAFISQNHSVIVSAPKPG